jgi:hypothetical protein
MMLVWNKPNMYLADCIIIMILIFVLPWYENSGFFLMTYIYVERGVSASCVARIKYDT